MSRICNNCGFLNGDDANVCVNCNVSFDGFENDTQVHKTYTDKVIYRICPFDFYEQLPQFWQKATSFCGRARRGELAILLFWNIVLLAVVSVGGLFSVYLGESLRTIARIALILPNVALLTRRLHDTGKSGWWLLIGFVPVAGMIAIIILSLIDSDKGENQYGEGTKYAEI